MSIDARVEAVHVYEDGTGKLSLVDRPDKNGKPVGIAGQTSLSFFHAPEEVTALNGMDVWGGSEDLMLGDRRIASRHGYTRLAFVERDEFNAAVAAARSA